ncbi:MAG: IPT/TIG domain-containing protein, partial [Bacteroidales bacterium]|nr:IPT/TIG domain-containing protein [Bacteroidales bacterium]
MQVSYNIDSTKYYFDFDVNVVGNNNNTFISMVSFYIDYNMLPFVTYTGEKVFISLDSQFATTTYEKHVSLSGNLGVVVNIRQGVPLLRTQLTITPKRLLHVKMELNNNLSNALTGFEFLYLTTAINVYVNAANAGYSDGQTYETQTYTPISSFLINTPVPTILSFTPTTRRAGLGEEIIISGSNFGTQKGKVLFTSAEAPTTTNAGFLKGLDAQYIETSEWTNTQIKVKVPSFVQDGYIGISGTEPGFGGSAGTGPIKVVRADSVTSAASSTTLTVEYSLTNYKENYNTNTPIERVYLIRHNCEYDFRFHLHTNIRDHADKVQIIAAIEAVISKWRTETGLNIIIAKNANNTDYEYKSTFTASYNIIGFDIISSNLDAEMGTSGSYGRNNGKVLRAQGGSHIRINPNDPWCYDTNLSNSVPSGQVGFYNALLHEVGHILLLGHIKYLGKLMHCGEAINAINPMINLANQSSAINGVNKTILDSKNIIWNNLIRLADSIPKPVITANSGLILCNNTLTLTTQAVLGGTYQWTKNNVNYATTQTITVSDVGVYRVIVTKGCSRISEPVTISTPFPTPIITASDTIICYGSPITLSVNNTPAATSYNWSNGAIGQSISVNSVGTYTVTVSNGLCEKTSEEFIISIPDIEICFSLSATQSCTVIASASGDVPPYYYEWLRNCNGGRPTILSMSNSINTSCLSNCPNTYFTLIVTDA